MHKGFKYSEHVLSWRSPRRTSVGKPGLPGPRRIVSSFTWCAFAELLLWAPSPVPALQATRRRATCMGPCLQGACSPGERKPLAVQPGKSSDRGSTGNSLPTSAGFPFLGSPPLDSKTPSRYPELPAPSLKSGLAPGCLEEPSERKATLDPGCRESLRSWPQTGLELPLDHSKEGNTRDHVTQLCPEILWHIASSNGSLSPAIHLLPNYGCQELLESASSLTAKLSPFPSWISSSSLSQKWRHAKNIFEIFIQNLLLSIITKVDLEAIFKPLC